MPIDWKQIQVDILDRLDIRAECTAFGVEFTAESPSAKGWLACRSIDPDRADENPSAAVNLKSGYYRDLGSGRKLSFWNFAAECNGYADWREARAHYAEKVGVELPTRTAKKSASGAPAKPETLADAVRQQLELETPAFLLGMGFIDSVCSKAGCSSDEKFAILGQTLADFAQTFAEAKGVAVNAILASGAQAGVWNRRVPEKYGVIAIPAYRPYDREKPTAYALLRADGKLFPQVSNKAGKTLLKPRKQHTLACSVDSLIVMGGWSALDSANTVVVVEGPTDAMALYPLLPAGYCVVTNTGGASSFDSNLCPAFAGKRVVVVMDADDAGQSGAKIRCDLLAQGRFDVEEVRAISLPYEVAPKKGKDVRDWIQAGASSADLLALIEASPRIEIGIAAIELTFEEMSVNDEAVNALARDDNLFCRDGQLVTIVQRRIRDVDASGVSRHVGSPHIHVISRHHLRERLTRTATFYTIVESGNGPIENQERPPDWCVQGVLHRGTWPELPELHGIAPCPVLRPDGSVTIDSGYDKLTGLFVADACQVDVPDSPSLDDGRRTARSHRLLGGDVEDG